MSKILDTVLLLALPASGKSEIRRYLDRLDPEDRRARFHMGPTVQLDDFPYVHFMRRIDDELARRGKKRMFFQAPDKSFRDPRDWGTLIELLNEDYEDLLSRKRASAPPGFRGMAERIDRAAVVVGLEARLGALDPAAFSDLAGALEKEAVKLHSDKVDAYPDALEGKTVVIEFARGGRRGAPMPLEEPFGYAYSLRRLSDAILSRASILYVWVTPEESRRKNEARTDPNDPGSILHHGVPIEVMLNDYGCDDVDWLEKTSARSGAISVQAHGMTFHVPLSRFDNRTDKTSFIREDEGAWRPEQIEALRDELTRALTKLASLRV